MVISISLASCYCTLTNAEIGELCFLSFHHMFLFSQDILCRVGAVLTTSSGGNRRPTLHRMILSKYAFDLDEDSEDLHFLKGQLKLNSSKILISEKEFDALIKQCSSEADGNLKKFFSSFKDLAEHEEYYQIEESPYSELISRLIPRSTVSVFCAKPLLPVNTIRFLRNVMNFYLNISLQAQKIGSQAGLCCTDRPACYFSAISSYQYL